MQIVGSVFVSLQLRTGYLGTVLSGITVIAVFSFVFITLRKLVVLYMSLPMYKLEVASHRSSLLASASAGQSKQLPTETTIQSPSAECTPPFFSMCACGYT